MSRLVMLIGVPCSGKTTWLRDYLLFDEPTSGTTMYNDEMVVGTDMIVDDIAAEEGTTYSAIWKDTINFATDMMNRTIDYAGENDIPIYWDQTNLTERSRVKKLGQIPTYYERVGVLFPTPNIDELKRRLASRPGKEIPWHVMERMLGSYEDPQLSEGFDALVRHDALDGLLREV